MLRAAKRSITASHVLPADADTSVGLRGAGAAGGCGVHAASAINALMRQPFPRAITRSGSKSEYPLRRRSISRHAVTYLVRERRGCERFSTRLRHVFPHADHTLDVNVSLTIQSKVFIYPTKRRNSVLDTSTLGTRCGVYRARRRVRGRPAWYALGPRSELLPPGIRVVGDDESESEVAAELLVSLRRYLATSRPVLELVTSDEPISPVLEPLSPSVYLLLARASSAQPPA
jgi:hypothetical protein